MRFSFDLITVVHQSSVTDWIQALAAFLAVIGTVFTLWKLYQRDEQKQAMIGELNVQSERLQAQTAELKAQVFQLGNIHQAIAKGIEVMANDKEVREMNRRNELRPLFISTSAHPDRIKGVMHIFENRGGTAKNVTAHWTSKNACEIRAITTQVDRGNKLNIQIVRTKGEQQAIAFDLIYEDLDGVKYCQKAYSENEFFAHLDNPFQTSEKQILHGDVHK